MSEILWQPSTERMQKSNIREFQHYLNLDGDYNSFHKYSVDNKNVFWTELTKFFGVKFEGSPSPALLEEGFANYTWFSNVKLNFAENLLAHGRDEDIALNSQHESGAQSKLTYKDLRAQTASMAQFLKPFLKSGDVLAAYMPNIPETVVSMLATSSLGGVFTSTSCDFGLVGVLDRFSQSNPKVLVAAVGYEYNGKYFNLTDRLREIEARLPGLEKIILVDFLGRGIDLSGFKKAVVFSDILQTAAALSFNRMPFSHPLYIMYSSGTTGKPKCIVHSQGGTLLGHIKELGLHTDLTSEKKIFFFTTCGWMMWNWLVSSLYFGAEVILYEGSPAMPSPEHYFKMIDRVGINIFGTSPKFLKAMQDTEAKFQSGFPTLETILSTGSPLLPEQYDYVYEKIKKDVQLSSISGGTDIIGCFMLGCPVMPVYRGEIQCLGLALDVAALDDNGQAVREQEGELICRNTFPNRPVAFLDDSSKDKINSAYFSQNPGFWTHGDFVKITKHGGVIVYGRSDATLNPGGVRIGTAEIYRQTEVLPFILDSLCVGKNQNGDVDVLLFVKLKAGEELTPERKKLIKEQIKKNTTPRHVPKEIHVVSDIPYTRSGKKVELAVSRILSGKPVTNSEALSNPECLAEYQKFI
ncbi:MAG: acetoacetate--CoA ligase [Bacteriovorax sp.]|jgi:acetoacetyl-CoA synthetase